jgi:hypothetical protein
LPVAVFGSGPNTIVFGALKCAMRSRHHAMRSALARRRVRLQRHERARRLAPLRVRAAPRPRLP